MMLRAASSLSESGTALCIVLIFLIPFAGVGLALINTGLGRARSAAHLMMSSLCVISIAALVYFVCGFAWAGIPGESGHTISAAGKIWDWLGAGPLCFRHLKLDGSLASLTALYGIFAVAIASLIPLGSGADRWRLGACCISTVLLAGWTYPLFAHWVWGGGWLAQLGRNFGLGEGFVDCGGSGVIQSLGGLTALSIAWILGPRRAKYTHDGMPTAIPGHNSVYVLFGCMLAFIGWCGLNSAGAILFAGVWPGESLLIAVNTLLCAATAGLTAAAITNVRFGKPDASLTANGWIGGLAASSAGCAFVLPVEAAAIGLIAGALVTLSVEWLELRMKVDDPSGSISAHAKAGAWGLLAVGIFARIPSAAADAANGNTATHSYQWLAQLVGIATLVGFVFPLTYGLNWLLNLVYSHRARAEGEQQGLDLFELGAQAYPEFLKHNDEFTE